MLIIAKATHTPVKAVDVDQAKGTPVRQVNEAVDIGKSEAIPVEAVDVGWLL